MCSGISFSRTGAILIIGKFGIIKNSIIQEGYLEGFRVCLEVIEIPNSHIFEWFLIHMHHNAVFYL